MDNPKCVLKNETHKLFWDFEIQTDHLVSARQPDLVIVKKKKKENLPNIECCCLGRSRSGNIRKRRETSIKTLLKKKKVYET